MKMLASSVPIANEALLGKSGLRGRSTDSQLQLDTSLRHSFISHAGKRRRLGRNLWKIGFGLCLVAGFFMLAKENLILPNLLTLSTSQNIRMEPVHSVGKGDLMNLRRDGNGTDQNIQMESVHSVSKRDLNLRRDGNGSSHCFYRDFEHHPDIHSGLPMVGEVFASLNRKWVYLFAETMGTCLEKYEKAHDFFTYSTNSSLPDIRYNCIFESDGSQVLSDPVFQTFRTRSLTVMIIVRCPVPKRIRGLLPASGSTNTTAHLTLESTLDLITGKSFSSPDAPKLSHLPICSHAWPSEEGQTNRMAPQKKRKISIMTRLALSYERGRDHEPLTVTQREFFEWVEYHLAIGIEHFYIFDDSPDPHNSTLREWCNPYVEQGLVTRVHYPKQDVLCDLKRRKGRTLYTGQIVSMNAAIRRYESETVWLGHWDVDEFLFIHGVSDGTSLSGFLDEYGKEVDEIGFDRLTYGVCADNTTAVFDDNALVLEHKQCYRDSNHVMRKGIFRTETALTFNVHFGMMRLDWPQGTVSQMKTARVDLRKGYVGHFRKGKAGGTWFPNRTSDFDPWVTMIKKRVDIHLS